MKKNTLLLLSLMLAALFSVWAVVKAFPSPGTEFVVRSVSRQKMMTGADESSLPLLELIPGQKLDINSAPADTLELLPGIGPELAEKMVRYREEQGFFSDAEDIMEVDGIGTRRYEALIDWIVIGEEAE